MPTLHIRLSQGTQQGTGGGATSTHSVELRQGLHAQTLRLVKADATLRIDPTLAPAAGSCLPGICVDVGERMFQGQEIRANVRGLGDVIPIPIEAYKAYYTSPPPAGAVDVTVSVPINMAFNATDLRNSFPITVRDFTNTNPVLMGPYPGAGATNGQLLLLDLYFDFDQLEDPNIY